MKIGELSDRTGVSRRLLRYYEEQGLIAPSRIANNYREYTEAFVDQVVQIRGLLDIGLPTRVVKQILPCLDRPRQIHIKDATPEVLALLAGERDRMAERIRLLVRNRDAISSYLEEVVAALRDDVEPSSGGSAERGEAAQPPERGPGGRHRDEVEARD
ncbi:MAG: MerR family transcriptional regulator [Segniliparus sp.]|uniref:MerR family transcriptional regulator n=1 Tax=Segniliparus sp. TaxID=2804064 RepID=UPI003F34C704